MPFRDRIDAGRQLAQALLPYRNKDAVILALPRGGVEVGAEIARALNAPLDILLVRKIGAPVHPELAVGAVIDGGAPIVVRNEEVIRLYGHQRRRNSRRSAARELAEIERRRKHYLGGRPAVDTRGKIAIVVDDGIATGATMRAALRAAAPAQSRRNWCWRCRLRRPTPSWRCAARSMRWSAWRRRKISARWAISTRISASSPTRM